MAISTKDLNKAAMRHNMGSFKMYYALEGEKLVRKLQEAKEENEMSFNMPPMPAVPSISKPEPMKVDKEGVHRTHCCIAHGCKYGDRDCPVETGRIKQDYTCEYCDDDGINNLEELQAYVMRSMNDKHPLVSEENYAKLYGSAPVTDIQEKVPVSLDLLQRVWQEMYRNPPEDNLVEFQNTMDEVIDLLDKWDALPELEDD